CGQYLLQGWGDPNVMSTSFVRPGGGEGSANVGGGVNILTVANTADARIVADAQVAATQDVIVSATATLQTTDLAGQPSALSFRGATAAVGGCFELANYD